ncbi:transcriptional regulator, HxlR family [Cohnella sp. OV330]|uniref:winged helix-turn-helix transcriptional regulator n=1 Tax=Cohnella sp. OV330 TaxID=1855288 RepID=UPI0008E2EBE1|nr:helix-turn-helix domain-containing protein [Cohnella sp. OV330]SFB59831.1 transcriptional regulator, HxlR family [Cohnella sp. OV330]
MIEFRDKKYRCASEVAMELVSGKWKVLILSHLSEHTFRFGELLKLMPGATHKMLAEQLRDLECDGLIIRSVYPVIPPKVEYELTDRGMRLVPILEALCDFGADYIDSFPAQSPVMEEEQA